MTATVATDREFAVIPKSSYIAIFAAAAISLHVALRYAIGAPRLPKRIRVTLADGTPRDCDVALAKVVIEGRALHLEVSGAGLFVLSRASESSVVISAEINLARHSSSNTEW